jgi:molybdopterin-guanine dinucleotide biosynthesis protein A
MLTIAILAGGRSERIGIDKALVPLAGVPMIEHVLRKVSGLGDELLISTNNPEQFAYLGIRTIPDLLPQAGSIIGLHSALVATQNKRVLSLGCDMPFVNRTLLEYISNLHSEADVIVPFYKGEYEPLHAIYSRNCIGTIENMVEENSYRIINIYDRVSVRTVSEREIDSIDPTGLSFFNINTPEDFALATEILDQIDG